MQIGSDGRVDEIRDERQSGGDFFVYLKPGFGFDGQHCFGARDLREVRSTMKRVGKCSCDDCLALTRTDSQP